ncbi:MAG: AbrB/MazE/SpoVT family DNA-binding domain-containing protein [Clostridia bacterium]|nr:AbrB/MazE/SpoVT family DNA-binding domain-containing protein [Clostridia bacterium]
MKSTGITRKVDELGRIVIPMELRNKLGIVEKDPLEIFVDGSSIILKKYNPNCIFCGSSKDLFEYNDSLICSKCQSKIAELNQKAEVSSQEATINTDNVNLNNSNYN